MYRSNSYGVIEMVKNTGTVQTYSSQHEVRPWAYCDDENCKTAHYGCRQRECFFESDNLSNVAQHVVENQFAVSNAK